VDHHRKCARVKRVIQHSRPTGQSYKKKRNALKKDHEQKRDGRTSGDRGRQKKGELSILSRR